LSQNVLTLRLAASNGIIDLRELRFTALWSENSITQEDHSAVGEVQLFLPNASDPVAVASRGDCPENSTATYCAFLESKTLTITPGTPVELSARIQASDDAESQNRSIFFLTLPRDGIAAEDSATELLLVSNDGVAPASGEIFIAPSSSMISPTRQNVPVYGAPLTPVFAKIASVQSATELPPLAADNIPLASLVINAASHANRLNGLNTVTLSGVIFNITASNIALDPSSLTLGTLSSPVVTSCAPLNRSGYPIQHILSGSFFASCSLAQGLLPTRIAQDTSQTFTLRGTVLSPAISPSKTSVFVVSLQHYNRSYRSFSPIGSHLIWEDQDSSGSPLYRWLEDSVGYLEFLRIIQ
jgi:hypothetical protein